MRWTARNQSPRACRASRRGFPAPGKEEHARIPRKHRPGALPPVRTDGGVRKQGQTSSLVPKRRIMSCSMQASSDIADLDAVLGCGI